MGCATSKSDDLPVVILCRDRLTFLHEALTHRYELAKSHTLYTQSLKSVGLSLQAFFDLQRAEFSPVFNLPPEPLKFPQPSVHPPRNSGSHSGSHIQFRSDSDGSCSGSIHHSGHSSPMHDHSEDYTSYGPMDPYSGSRVHINYMQRRYTPSVLYEQRPNSPRTGYMGESSYYNSAHNSNYGSSYFPNYGYYSSSSVATSSTSRQPPLPPSPPKSSSWDFLNFFEPDQNVEFGYRSKTPSRNSREVRDEEGIPDLENEDYEQEEVVKEVHGNQKFVKNQVQSKIETDHLEDVFRSGQSISSLSDGSEFEVNVGSRKVVEREKSQEQVFVEGFKSQGGPRGVSQVVGEIQMLFNRASEAGDELSKILEAGKVPYRKNATSQAVSSKMLNVISPISLVSSKPEFDEEMGLKMINLSSTLQKCYLWEKKLYEGVKAEEKMRLVHERKCRKLKRLDERGAEASKLDSTRAFVRNKSTEIRIAIQVVDKISDKINQLRDEELWPQIKELIQGLTRMWKSMAECHRGKCQAIKDAWNSDAIAFQKKFKDGHLEATLQLEHELLNWAIGFSNWIGAQRGYVQALNNWLKKCLLYVPEETADGIIPFSPGRMGAPPLFVICNQWCQALERISEKEVVDSIRVLATNVLRLWERDKDEMRQKMVANKDMERTVKKWEKEDLRIQKGIHALDKMAIMSGDGLGISVGNETSSLQGSLQHVFESLERFASNSTRAYEEILRRGEEIRVPHGGGPVELSN